MRATNTTEHPNLTAAYVWRRLGETGAGKLKPLRMPSAAWPAIFSDLDSDGVAILAAKLFGDSGGSLEVQVGDRDPEAVSVRPLGNGLTHTLAAAGNERDLANELSLSV